MKSLLTTLLLLVALSACSGGTSVRPDAGPAPAPATTRTPPHWTTTSDPQWLFEIEHPDTWERGPLLVSHGDRRQWEMLSLATYDLEPGGARCDHVPVKALDDLGSTDAFLYVQEPEYVHGLPPRRAVEIRWRTRPSLDDSIFSCIKDPRDLRYAFVPFRERGRSFFAHLALGPRASDGRRRQLLRTFESLRILSASEYRSRHGGG